MKTTLKYLYAGVSYALIFLAIQLIVSGAAIFIINKWIPSTDPSSATALVWMSLVSSALAIILFIAARWCPVSRNWVRERQWLTYLWTVLVALGIILPLNFLNELLPKSWTVNLVPQMADMMKSTTGYFALAMFAPLCEEIIFRGAIIRALLRVSDKKWLAIVFSALIFSLVHGNPAQMPTAFVVGCLLGWIFVRTNSIVLCCILHWINNSSAYVLANMFPTIPIDAPMVAYFGGNHMAVYQAVFSSLLIALPSLYQLNRTLKK